MTRAGLDASRRRWDALVAAGPAVAVWGFLVTLRPLWWVARAWLAAELIDMSSGHDGATVVPTLYGVLPGVLVTAVLTVVSVQIGRGRCWPGSRRTTSLSARLALLLLNASAVVVAPFVLGQFPGAGGYAYVEQGQDDAGPTGLTRNGSLVENVFPYDSSGRPLTGVQLFDQRGRPLSVGPDVRIRYGNTTAVALYPWSNGGHRLWNTYPLPERHIEGDGTGFDTPQTDDWTSERPPALPSPLLAVVPPATLPTSAATPAATPTPTASPTATSSPSAGASPSPSPSPRNSGKRAGR